jgi:hypothetical protein
MLLLLLCRRSHRWLASSSVGVVHEPEDNQHPCGLHRSLRCRRLQLRWRPEWRPCVDPSSSSGCSRGASADRAFRAAARSSRMLLRLDAQRLWQDWHHCGRLVLPSRRLSGRCFAEVRRPLLHAGLAGDHRSRHPSALGLVFTRLCVLLLRPTSRRLPFIRLAKTS